MPDTGYMKQVRVVKEGSNTADASQTKALLESTWTGSFYKCPRCSYQTLDQELMISHLAEEINAALNSVAFGSPEPGKPKG